MICVRCKLIDSTIKDGEEVVVELAGKLSSGKTIENMHTEKDIEFLGHIRHKECYDMEKVKIEGKEMEAVRCTL